MSGSGTFVSSQSIRKENALDAESVLNQQANAQLTYSGRFSNNKTLTVKASQSHNLVTNLLERQIPDIQYRMGGPLFDFELDEDEVADKDGSFKSYLEKLNYNFTNRFNYYTRRAVDSASTLATGSTVDTTAEYVGYTGNFSVNYSGSLFDVINVTPSANFAGYWTGTGWINPQDSLKYRKRYMSLDPEHDSYGEVAYNHNYSISADTKLYGIWVPEIGRFTGVRHVLSPSLSYTYAPEIDTVKKFSPHPLLGQTPYQTKQKTVGLSLSNDFDIKYLKVVGRAADTTKGDTSKAVEDQYGTRRLFTTKHNLSYNFAADSLRFSDISSSFGFQILQDYLFTINTRHSFYHKYSGDPNKIRVPELTYYGYDFSKHFSWSGTINAGLPSQMSKYEMLKWTFSLDYSYSFGSSRVGKDLFQDKITHSTGISATLQPTKNWEMTYSTRYNYNEGKFVTHSFTFNRVLHCWQLDFSWTPTGPAAGWSFSIYVRDLPDIKFNTGSTESSTVD